VREDGSLAGVRVLAHNETTGWGDYIEIVKSKWIKAFDGKSLGEHADTDWQVRKDGGNFDYVTRATVSARAVVGGVHQALKYYAAHKEDLFSNARVIE
jgi:Na+-translocating ferredoxin:NAD+ oxidoreductase subunit G